MNACAKFHSIRSSIPLPSLFSEGEIHFSCKENEFVHYAIRFGYTENELG